MASTEKDQQELQRLRQSMGEKLAPDINTNINMYRWISRWKDDAEYYCDRYLQNRKVAGLDVPDFLDSFYSLEVVSKFAPFFSFGMKPNIVNQNDNTVVFIIRLSTDFHRMTKVMTCGQFLTLYQAIIEWNLRQVLKRENESGQQSGLTVLVDAANFKPLKYLNPNSAIFQILTLCAAQDYNDIMRKVIVINTGRMFTAFLKLLKGSLPSAASAKIDIISNSEDLKRRINPAVLPVKYGGNRRLTQADRNLGGVSWDIDFDTCASVPRSITRDDYFVARQPESSQTIKRGGTFVIKQDVAQIGAKLRWSFTVNHEIRFQVHFETADKQVPVIPSWRIRTPKLPEEGKITCANVGTYALQFANGNKRTIIRSGDVKLKYVVDIEPA